MAIDYDSIFINLEKKQLHLMRISSHKSGPVVFMLHGAIENGRIFYSKNGKGLAPYLAEQGFDVFVPDLSGKGLSTPSMREKFPYSQTESITEDIPVFLNQINSLRGECAMFWVAHSWGGVLLSSFFARFKQKNNPLAIAYFGTKKTVKAHHIKQWLIVNVIWNKLSLPVSKLIGYLPANAFKMGSDDESIVTLKQSIDWVKSSKWIDTQDNFNYGQAALEKLYPPMRFYTGVADHSLGHYLDVKEFIEEHNLTDKNLIRLGKQNGALEDYDHISILTHPSAIKDHFPQVLSWFVSHLH